MTVVVLLGAYGAACAICGSLGAHRWHRGRTAAAEHKAGMWEYMRDVAENRVTELAYAEQHLARLRRRTNRTPRSTP